MHSVTLEPREARRIGSIAALLSSDREGEVLAAANMLSKALAKHDLRISEVVERGLQPAPLPPPPRPQWTSTPPPYDATLAHQLKAAQCIRCTGRFNSKELDFLRELRVTRRPSPKQREWLDRLHARIVEDF